MKNSNQETFAVHPREILRTTLRLLQFGDDRPLFPADQRFRVRATAGSEADRTGRE